MVSTIEKSASTKRTITSSGNGSLKDFWKHLQSRSYLIAPPPLSMLVLIASSSSALQLTLRGGLGVGETMFIVNGKWTGNGFI